jgi:uncharacterized membrane protein YfcA
LSITEIVALTAAAALGGAINAVAGGGTLVTFPTLLLFGTASKIANATSTLALVLGTSGSIFGYRRHIQTVKPWLRLFLPASILGGVLGAVLLTLTKERIFAKLVPFLILFATILFVSQTLIRRWLKVPSPALRSESAQEQFPPPQPGEIPSSSQGSSGCPDPVRAPASLPLLHNHALVGAVLLQFAVSLYGGYFGAGIGILMLASLGFIGLHDIHQMNTIKTILGSLINLVAAIWFIFAGLMDWPRVAVMTFGAISGYYLGAHYSQRLPQSYVRRIVTAVGFTLAAITFYQQFLR